MTRKQIIRDKDFRFSTQELVCPPHIYERFGDVALQYFDIRLLETLLWIRKNIGLPMTTHGASAATSPSVASAATCARWSRGRHRPTSQVTSSVKA